MTVSNSRTMEFAVVATLAGMLCGHWVLATTAVAGKSATFDEPAHLGSGLAYWRLNDYRLNVQNGLPQRLASLPLLVLTPAAPAFSDGWKLPGSEFVYGESVLRRAGGRAPLVLHAARMTMALVGVVLACLVWSWSKRVHGSVGGLVSLTACCLEPSLLANAPLAATDIPVTCTLFASTIAIWRTLERVTPGRVCLSCLAVSALLLTKWTGVLIVPITGLLMIARLLLGMPSVIGRRWEVRSRIGQATLAAGLGLLHAAAVWTAMWASVGFRFSPTTPGAAGESAVRQQWNELIFEKEYRWRPAIDWLREHQVIPETFLASFAGTAQGAASRRAFFFGEVRDTGFLWFFPYCLWAKTNPALFVLLAVAALLAIRHGDREKVRLMLPLFALLAVYGTTALNSRLNLGQRHLLPIFPALFVVAGGASLALTAPRRSRLDRGLRWLVLTAVAVYPITAVMVWPNYLAYFNSLSGGPVSAYRRLVDSSLDWGQELVSLEKWLRRKKLPDADTPVYLSSFSSLPPQHYGLRLRYLPSFFLGSEPIDFPEPLEPGVYCVSATMLWGIYSGGAGELSQAKDDERRRLDRVVRLLHDAGEGSELWKAMIAQHSAEQWQKIFNVHAELRFSKLCSLLRTREPDEVLGSAMLIYSLSAAELAQVQ